MSEKDIELLIYRLTKSHEAIERCVRELRGEEPSLHIISNELAWARGNLEWATAIINTLFPGVK